MHKRGDKNCLKKFYFMLLEITKNTSVVSSTINFRLFSLGGVKYIYCEEWICPTFSWRQGLIITWPFKACAPGKKLPRGIKISMIEFNIFEKIVYYVKFKTVSFSTFYTTNLLVNYKFSFHVIIFFLGEILCSYDDSYTGKKFFIWTYKVSLMKSRNNINLSF